MFRLVTLNLNGIRSAAAKGFLPFADKLRADCMGVQEIKAQAADMAGRFEHVGGMKGHFHYAEKKGYSGVGLYARRLLASGVGFDMLFGPAYKGITLASATAVALAALGRNVPFCHNRKEAKDHGEGGLLVGAPLKGRVVIVDDVITDGASKRESVELIRAAGAEPVAVLIAMDRMERGGRDDNLSAHSAVDDFEREYGLPVLAIATLADLMRVLRSHGDASLRAHFDRVAAYRERYGV